MIVFALLYKAMVVSIVLLTVIRFSKVCNKLCCVLAA